MHEPPPRPAPLADARTRRALSVALLGTAVLYLAVVVLAGPEEILARLSEIPPGVWALVLATSTLSYLLRFWRWQFYLSAQGHRIPVRRNLLYYLAGFALTATPGKAGETIRSVYLKAHDVRYAHSLATFFSERLLDVVVVGVIATAGLLVFAGHAAFVALAALLLVLVLLVLRDARLATLVGRLAERVPFAGLARVLRHGSDLLAVARWLLGGRRLLVGCLLGAAAWTVQGLAFWYILLQFGFEAGAAIALGIYAISLLAGAATFVPGGIGGTEATMGLLLAASGADTATAVAAPLLSRLTTLWYAVFLGLLASAALGARAPLPSGAAPD